MAVVIPIISEWNPKGVQRAMADIKKAGSNFDKFAVGVNAASRVAVVGLAGIAAASFKMIEGLEKANQANAALDNVLNSMGYPKATKRVSDYAESLEKTLAVDADVIKATQTKLATFAELTKTVDQAGGSFDRATLAALDLAAAGFGTAENNAVQLGKALQDPIKGITALAKSGVTFTAQEKEKIRTLVESGKTLEAQDLILQAIEKQVGGTAEATALGSTKMKLAFAAAADSIAVALLPAFEGLTDIVLKLTPIIEANGGAIGKALLVFGGFAAAIIALNYAIKAYIVITQIVKAATVAWTFAQSALNVALFANPIGLVVLAIVALIAGLVLAYQKSEAFRNMIQQLWEWLKIIGTFIKDGIVGYFNLWVNAIKSVVDWVDKLLAKFNLVDKFKGLFGGSTTLSGSISQTNSNNAQNGSRASVYMNDEMLARGISRILQNSDQRNGGSLAFS